MSRLDEDTLERMEGLIKTKSKLSFILSIDDMIEDLLEEGFDSYDIMLYLYDIIENRAKLIEMKK